MNAAERVAQVRRATDLLRRSEERFRLLVESVQDYAIFMLDVDGRVASWNLGAQRLKGWSADEIIGRSFTTFYPPEAIARGWPQEELRRATEHGRLEDEGWRLRKDGTRFWANVVITALRGPDGELRGFAKVTRDLTERRRQEEVVRHSEEQLRLLIEGVRDYAIFMLDEDGRVLTWNAGASAIKGYAAADVIGRHVSMFYAPDDVAAGLPARELAAALRDGRARGEGWRLRKDGSVFWAEATLTSLIGPDGALRGFANITRDLTETRRVVELEQSTRRMSEFLAMLAHELRNPLAPIRNAVTILKMQPDLPPVLERSAEIVDRQLGHLTRLVDDLLDVGRIATGKILLKTQRIDFRDVVRASVEAARPLIDERGHALVLDLPDTRIDMEGDPTRLAQALQNLLNNAARYTPDGGRITLAVHVDGAACVASVADNGRGIAPHALERIFELFVQEEAARAPADAGLGIGLSLARTLVELHGGMLAAASPGEGRGSTFTLRLPLHRAGHPPRAERTDRAPHPAVAATRCRVLVVDDNRDSADTMVAVLELLGHEACAAYDGEQALVAAGRLRPQLVLLDLNMPGADGFAVMRQLRTLPEPPFVAAMTGYGQQGDRADTLAAGFHAHLTKPVDADQLGKLIAQALAK